MKDIKFMKALAAGKTPAQAAQACAINGRKLRNPREAAAKRLQRIQKSWPELMREHGLGEHELIENHLKPLLAATEVKVFNGKDGILYSDPLVAHDIRAKALDMSFRVSNAYAQSDQSSQPVNTQINVVIHDVSKRVNVSSGDQRTVAAEATATP